MELNSIMKHAPEWWLVAVTYTSHHILLTSSSPQRVSVSPQFNSLSGAKRPVSYWPQHMHSSPWNLNVIQPWSHRLKELKSFNPEYNGNACADIMYLYGM